MRFDGPDLDEVAALAALSTAAVVEQLVAAELTVAFVGFLPGFAYLEGLPDALAAVPRRSTPRTAVAAGSLAIGGGFAGIYPQASPGGWQLLGRTGFGLFDPEAPPFAVLCARRQGPPARRRGRGPGDPRGHGSPLRSTASRHGGGRDPGPAVDGAGPGPHRRGASGGPPGRRRRPLLACGRPTGWWETTTVPRPSRSPRSGRDCASALRPTWRWWAEPRRPSTGGPSHSTRWSRWRRARSCRWEGRVGDLRCYLAVAGGFDIAPVFGSRSSDVLTGLGPGAPARR